MAHDLGGYCGYEDGAVLSLALEGISIITAISLAEQQKGHLDVTMTDFIVCGLDWPWCISFLNCYTRTG